MPDLPTPPHILDVWRGLAPQMTVATLVSPTDVKRILLYVAALRDTIAEISSPEDG